MILMKSVVVSAALAVGVAIAGASLGAQQSQQPLPRFEQQVNVEAAPVVGAIGDHFLTFSAPLALPGVSLPAGTYVFRSEPSGVLRVMNAKRDETYVMTFTIPLTRSADLNKYEVRFIEPTSAGAPYRLSAYFTPGSSLGKQLLYAHPDTTGEDDGR